MPLRLEEVEARIDSRRRLPHWAPAGVPIFVTWRLAGTLARTVESRKQEPTAGARFASADRELDRATSGPTWLADPRVASMLIEALRYGECSRGFYELFAFVVMPNHVHVIWRPTIPQSRILRWLKGVTAKRAKNILSLEVKAFWQDESYDHWIRSEKELQRVIRYVEWNPVRAGFADRIADWPWSSAAQSARPSASPSF